MAYPDALAGGPAARVGGGPLLLTEAGRLPDATSAELTRLRPGRIVVLGGTGAVSGTVLNALKNYTTGSVTRIAGADRYATAAAISQAAFPSGSDLVYVATGDNYPDALAAGAAAAYRKAPVLLVRANAIPAATAAELLRLDPSRIVIAGGTGVISAAVAAQLATHGTVTRQSGDDRYASAVAVSAATFGTNGVSIVYVATGRSFPDGLSAGPVAGKRGGPLLLVPGTSLPASVAAELKRLDPTHIVIVGGTGAVSNTVRNQIRALWP
jgi:putative cell wall-binding protein